MSQRDTHIATDEDQDFDYGALIADSDIDEDALLHFDPDAADPDNIKDSTDLVSDSVAEEFEPPEDVDDAPAEPAPVGDPDQDDFEEFTPPEPIETEPEDETATPVVPRTPVRALDPSGPPIIAVCGLSGGAGTTTFAMLLAYTASKQKRRRPVLLTDLGGPSASMAAYVSKRGAHSLASAANAHRAGLFGADGKAPFVDLGSNLRLMAREPGFADDEIGTPEDPYIYDLLVDAQEDHFATVVDCGRLERPAEVAVAERATHIVWMVNGTPSAARRARAALKTLPFRGSRSSILVVRLDDGDALNDRSEQDIRHAADSGDADIVLCPDAGDVVSQGLDRTAKKAIQPVKATLRKVFQ